MSPQINKILIAAALAFAGMVSHTAGIQWNVPMHHDWWWNAPEKPQITVCAANADTLPARCNVTLSIETDTHHPVSSISQTAMIAAGDSVNFTFDFNLMPGFYGCTVTGNGAEVKKFNIGYEPENIVSLPDAQPDFDEFWQRTLNELAAVAPKYRLTEDKEKSGNGGKVYVVSMKSLGGVEIKGYLTMPDKASKNNRLPVVVHYMGYGSKPWHAEPREDARCIDFVLSTRGQGLNQPGNQYGEWVTYGIGDREQYYYRGAFMDLIRAVDFVCSLPEADTRYVFAEGGSQGGGFTLVACALDKRIRAGAPHIPFLNDYPDYLEIATWTADILAKAGVNSGNRAGLLKMMSYFDVKNFARRITCPILMGVGLQDPTCPPHTNFAGYNLISSQKQFVIYPECGHTVRQPDWNNRMQEFFGSFVTPQ